MECFGQLKDSQSASTESKNPKKKAKTQPSGSSEQRRKALAVLFDLLIAQLTKSQSFVREMANYVFKQFCGELDSASLDQLLEIVSKPLAKDENMLEADSSEDEDESNDSDMEMVEDVEGQSDNDESDGDQ